MRIKNLIIKYKFIFFLFILSCKIQDKVPTDKKLQEKFIFYDLLYKRKTLMKQDTITYNYKIVISNENCNYKIENKNKIIFYIKGSLYTFYKKEKLYKVINKNKYALFITPICNPFNEILRDSTFIINKNDTIQIQKSFKKNNGLYKYAYYIKNNKIAYIRKDIEYYGFHQYEEFNFKNFMKGSMNIDEEFQKYKKSFKKFEKKDTVANEKKDNLSKISFFTGKFIDGTNFSSKKYEQTNVLYFFWHDKCLPCLISLPKLNQLARKYKNHVVFIGINPKNNKKIVSKVWNKYNVDFASVYTQDFKDEIFYYPLFVISSNDKIIYSSSGYSDLQFKKIDSVLSSLKASLHKSFYE